MSSFIVPIKFTPGVHAVHLRELCGHDESTVENSNLGAIQLLNQLLLNVPGIAIGKGEATKLVIADRDRLMAALYKSSYGNRIESSLNCSQCKERFDLDFTVDELLDHLQNKVNNQSATLQDNGTCLLSDGTRFRLPTGEDECAVLGLKEAEAKAVLMQRCLLNAAPGLDREELEHRMAEVAPVLQMDMQAVCPECNHQQSLYFDMQHFFLRALQEEQKLIASEVHLLARSYHWNQEEILRLSRGQRRTYVGLIESEMEVLQ